MPKITEAEIIGTMSIGPAVAYTKDERTEAIRENTKALLELAQAIREHTYAVAPQVDEDEDEGPTCYMDGTPILS